MLQTLRGSSRVMLGLVEDVLDFSKIEAGKVVLEKTDFDLHALVNSTCRIVAAQAAAKGVEFVVSIMPEVPPAVRGDPHHLRQMLINLAGNAVKFTERGSVTVHVSAQAETETRGAAQVLDPRHRHRHRARGAGAHLRELHAGRPVDHAPLRRHRPGHHHRQAAGRADGRAHRPGERGRPGQHVLVRDRAREAARARRARGAGELAGARVLLVGFPPAQRERARGRRSPAGARRRSRPRASRRAWRAWSPRSAWRKPYHSALLYAAGEDLQARAALPPRGARTRRRRRCSRCRATPTCRASRRSSSGFAAVLELPFDKRQLFNVLHSVAAGEESREGVVRLQDYARARRRGAASCACWWPTTIRPTAR